MQTSPYRTRAPRVDPGGLAELVASHFGIDAVQATPIASERDLTARIVARDGGAFVFKLGNAADDPDALAFENRALRHVAAADPDLPVPVVIGAPDGRTELVIELDGGRHIGRLQTFLPGLPAHQVRPSCGQRRAFGRTLGRLSRALRDFRDPAEHRAIIWDLKRLPEIEPLTAHIDDPDKRTLARESIRRFVEVAQPVERTLRTQAVHNDFHFHNVLVDPQDHDAVSGVIDFGDMVRTPLVYDVAIALSFQLAEEGRPLAYACDFLAAYQREYPLLPEEVDLLFDLIGARNAMTVTISEWRAKLYPENAPYILRNNPRASLALFRFAALTREEARSELRAACGC